MHVVADRLDDAGTFVTEHHRRRPVPVTLDDVQVGAADADGGDTHENLVRPWLAQLDLPHLERAPDRIEERSPGSHVSSSATSSSTGRSSAMLVSA